MSTVFDGPDSVPLVLSRAAACVLSDWLLEHDDFRQCGEVSDGVFVVLTQLSGVLEANLNDLMVPGFAERVRVAGRFLMESPPMPTRRFDSGAWLLAPTLEGQRSKWYRLSPESPEDGRAQTRATHLRLNLADDTIRQRLAAIRRTWCSIYRKDADFSALRSTRYADAIAEFFAEPYEWMRSDDGSIADARLELRHTPPGDVVENVLPSGYGIYEPEVVGRAQSLEDSSDQVVFAVDDWLGDDLVEILPHFLMRPTAVERAKVADLSGFMARTATVRPSDIYHALHDRQIPPEFEEVQIVGSAGWDDFGLTAAGRLVLSDRAAALLRMEEALYWREGREPPGASSVVVLLPGQTGR